VSRTSADGRAARDLKLDLEAPAWETLEEEAANVGMSIEELVGFSVLYYLADRDSGRIARHVRSSSPPEQHGENPLDKLLDG
jgi:hypothetical protein